MSLRVYALYERRKTVVIVSSIFVTLRVILSFYVGESSYDSQHPCANNDI